MSYIYNIHKGQLYESPILGAGNNSYSVDSSLPNKSNEFDRYYIKSDFSVGQIESLPYGFKFDLVTNMDDPFNRNDHRKPIICFVSKSDIRPNIYLFYKPRINAFSLKYRGEITKNLFKIIAQGFICNTLDELKDFLSKSHMLQDSYWDFIN